MFWLTEIAAQLLITEIITEQKIYAEQRAVSRSRTITEMFGPGINPLVADPPLASDKGIAHTLRVHLITPEVILDLDPGRASDRIIRSILSRLKWLAHLRRGRPVIARDRF